MQPPAEPYADLDPVARVARGPQPGAFRSVLRGLRRRCPRCGARGLFTGPLAIRERCPGCRFRLEREEGGFLGAMTINFAVSTTLWLILLVGWLIIDLPDLHALRLTVASLALMTIAPLALWGHAKTIWASIDYLVYRSDPAYADLEAADRAFGDDVLR
ncbi:MAG: DUF983 domain-containing protein [Actinomycetota bacterium]